MAGGGTKACQGLIYGVLLNTAPFFNFCRISSSCKVGRKGKSCRFHDVTVELKSKEAGSPPWGGHRGCSQGGREPGTEPLPLFEPTTRDPAVSPELTVCSLCGPPRAGLQGHGGKQSWPDPCPVKLTFPQIETRTHVNNFKQVISEPDFKKRKMKRIKREEGHVGGSVC